MKTRFSFVPKLSMYLLTLFLVLASLVFTVPILAGSAMFAEQKLLPNDTPVYTGDAAVEVYNFGAEIALSGNTLAVGSDTAKVSGKTVSVYVYDGKTFNLQARLTPAQGNSFTDFGRTLAIDGDTLVVGAYGVNGQGVVYVFVRSGSNWSQQAILTSSDGSPNDSFACSLAISGDTVIAGAVNTTSASGAEYIFVRNGGAWSQQAKLSTSDAATSSYFGIAGSISGDTAVILGWGKNQQPGACYVFVRSGSAWSQQAKLTANVATDFYGGDVSISGDTFVVSAPSVQKAFVFFRSGQDWTLQASLLPGHGVMDSNVCISGDAIVVQSVFSTSNVRISNGDKLYDETVFSFNRNGTSWNGGASSSSTTTLNANAVYSGGDVAVSGGLTVDSMCWSNTPGYVSIREKGVANRRFWSSLFYSLQYFGRSVAINGDTMVVGVGAIGNSSGAVYVYTRSGSNWSQQAKLTALDPEVGDYFGISVSISGDTVVVGKTKTSGTGAAYVFTRSGTAWSQQAKLTAPDDAQAAYFGYAVAIGGDTVVVGAEGYGGAAYVFTRNSGTWSQQAKLTASDTMLGDDFGFSVSISGDTVLVGADYKDSSNGDIDSGAAYVFTRSGSVWSQQAKLTASDAGPKQWFGYSVCVSGDTAVIGPFGVPTNPGAAYVFTRSGSVWNQQTKLAASDAAPNDHFGFSFSMSGDILVIGAEYKDSHTGAAYVFTRSGTSWSQRAKITGSDSAAGQVDIFGNVQQGDYFGNAVSISGDTVVVGAYGKSSHTGAAYVYNLSASPTTTTTSTPASTTAPPTSSNIVTTSTAPTTAATTAQATTTPVSTTTAPVTPPPTSNSIMPWLIAGASLLVIAGVIFVIYSRRNKT